MTLVEYGDFQCPFCGAAHPVVQEVLRQLEDMLRFAAEASEAAAARDQFWRVYDWMFEHQDRLDMPSLIQGLTGLGLDGQVIRTEVLSHRNLNRVRSDLVGGVHSGVNGTPTFYINGLRHDGGYSRAELLRAMNEAAA